MNQALLQQEDLLLQWQLPYKYKKDELWHKILEDLQQDKSGHRQ